MRLHEQREKHQLDAVTFKEHRFQHDFKVAVRFSSAFEQNPRVA